MTAPVLMSLQDGIPEYSPWEEPRLHVTLVHLSKVWVREAGTVSSA